MRAHSTTVDPKCDILFVPDVVLGAGEAMRRREFIAFVGSTAVAWPPMARAQQSAMPVIGFLHAAFPEGATQSTSAFLKGLGESGYVEGRNCAIEYRWADGRLDQLPVMAADLVNRQVAVMAAGTTPAALAAKVATTTIPVVFETAANPVQLGLVVSLNRPGGNVTGVTQANAETTPKRLELLHELLPTTKVMALLVNPSDPGLAESETSTALAAAHRLGLDLNILHASDERDFNGVFLKVTEMRAGGLVIGGDVLFTSHVQQIAALALQHAIPAAYQWREFAAAGGLLSYGSDITESYRLAGIYTGRILKGEKPTDLPVQQVSKVQLYINLKTAKAFGITVPLPVSGRADEVFE
jgi:putative tryptophan/tyrosine transport system substrate-binding protein